MILSKDLLKIKSNIMKVIDVILDDITTLRVDAIVNAPISPYLVVEVLMVLFIVQLGLNC